MTEAPPPNRSGLRHHRALVCVLALSLGLLALAVVLPSIVREVIESQISGRIDLEGSLEDVDLDPFEGSIALHGLALRAPAPGGAADADEAEASGDGVCFLCIERIDVDLAWRSLWEQGLRIESIVVVGPRLRLVRAAQGELDLPELAARDDDDERLAESPDPSQAPDASARAAPALRVDRLRVEGGALSFRDLTVESPELLSFEIDEIELRRFASGPTASYDSPARIALEAEIAGAPVTLDARWRAASSGLMINGDFDASGLPLPRTRAYLAEFGLHGTQGTLDLGITVDSRRDARDSATIELSLNEAALDWRTASTASDVPGSTLAMRLEQARLDARLGARELGELLDRDSSRASLSGQLRIADFEASPAEPTRRFEASFSGLTVDLSELRVERAAAASGEESSADPDDAQAPPSVDRLRIDLDRIELRSPRVRLTQDTSGLFLPGPAGRSAASSVGSEPSVGKDTPVANDTSQPETVERSTAAPGSLAARERLPRIRIGSLRISEGLFEWMDRRIEPHVRVELDGLEMRGEQLSWPPGALDSIDVEATPAKGEALHASGSATLPHWQATIEARRIPISHFNPYLERDAGYRAQSGELSLESRLEAVDPAAEAPGALPVEASTRLTLHGLALQASDEGHPFRSRFGVPLSIALALLRDRAGEIVLDFDFRASPGDGVSLELTDTIRSALGQAILNALDTPMRILGRLRRSGGEVEVFEPLVISFVPGEAQLHDEGERELDAIADLMVARPGLALTLEGLSRPRALDATETAASESPPERLARDRIDRVCRFFRTRRGLSAERILVRRALRIPNAADSEPKPDAEPGLSISLAALETASESDETRPCESAEEIASKR